MDENTPNPFNPDGDDPGPITSETASRQTPAHIAFGPVPELSNAALPQDVGSLAFQTAARDLKGAFERREDFTAFLCTQIAARGVIPNATLVLGIGAWGSKGDVSRDVKAWYAQVARRSAEQEMVIPPALRRPALQLLEELWLVASRQAQNHIEADREKAQRAHATMTAELADALSQLELTRHLQTQVEVQRDEATRLSEELRRQIDMARQREVDLNARIEADRVALSQKEEALRNQHRQDLQRAHEEHRAEVDAIKRQAAHQNQALEASKVAALAELQGRLDASAASLQEARQQARESAEFAAQQSRQMALALDKARQDALAAAQQAIKAQRDQASVADKIAELHIRNSLLGRDLAQAISEKNALKALVEDLRAQAQQASEKLAAPKPTSSDA